MSQTIEHTDSSSMREHDEPEKKKQKSRRPPNTAFRQQRLKAWQPILTPKTVLPLFFAVGIIFAPIGGLLLWTSAKVQEISIDYSECVLSARNCSDVASQGVQPIPDDKYTAYFKSALSNNQKPSWCNDKESVNHGKNGVDRIIETNVCRLQFYVPETLEAPVLMYYHLTKFYQNHRRYVKSFDQSQLSGDARTAAEIEGSNCDPLKGETQPDGTFKPFYPCGLIANSLFNDTIFEPVQLNVQDGSGSNRTYTMTNNGTAWASDANLYGQTKYTADQVVPPLNWRDRIPVYNASFPLPSLHNDDNFQVWMRTAGLPTFSKLYRRNDNDHMQASSYEIKIYDYFPVTPYGGTKSVLISTRTVMGGRNPFLGIAYVIVGGLCVLLGGLFTVTQLIRPRKLGDHSYLSWNTDQPSTATTTGRAPRPNEAA